MLCYSMYLQVVKVHLRPFHMYTETEKIKCLKPYERFHICTETEHRTENVHDFDFIFFALGGRISANMTGKFNKICTYTTTCVVYNLVIMKAIDGLSSETTVRLFYKHNTIDYRLLWDNTQSDYKDHELKRGWTGGAGVRGWRVRNRGWRVRNRGWRGRGAGVEGAGSGDRGGGGPGKIGAGN